MHFLTKRKIFGPLLALVLIVTLAVSAAVAADRKDALFPQIRAVYEVVEQNHKDGADLDKFINGAIKGGLEALGDPYTNYFPGAEYQQFLESLNGTFSGIGAFLEQDGSYVVITSPIKDTPAYKAGLKSGDRIVEVNGTNLVGGTTDKAVSLIRGPAGTEVTLKIERPSDGTTQIFKITRAVITVPEVEQRMLDGEVGYLQLASFGDHSVKEFYDAVADLKGKGAKGLVLDLRQNGGGYLDAAIQIASAFVPEGKPVVWEVGKNGKTSQNSSGTPINLPVAVLIDKGSASASEILAGAIQDYQVGPLVGTKSFGKGTVQQIMGLTTGGGIKVTIAEYLTPNEHHVHGIGLTPDYLVDDAKAAADAGKPLGLIRRLTLTSSGDDVQALQSRLTLLGYHPDTDGFFGLKTGQAVVSFARAYGLNEEPAVDLPFVEVLNQVLSTKGSALAKNDAALDKAAELVRAKISH